LLSQTGWRSLHFKTCRFSSLLPALPTGRQALNRQVVKRLEASTVLFFVEKEVADAWIFHQK
jgi:hypothetical protein